MSRLSRLSHTRRCALAALSVAALSVAALTAGPTAAQTIYKVQMPDGSILFTDAPPQGGKIIEERDAKVTPRPARSPAAAPVSQLPGTSSDPARGASGNRLTLEAAMGEINAAESALAAAKRRLELGREPLPGERLGLAGGGSRLSPAYHERIAGLEKEVVAAESRVQAAYAARNAVR